jgi:hypothetical protein
MPVFKRVALVLVLVLAGLVATDRFASALEVVTKPPIPDDSGVPDPLERLRPASGVRGATGGAGGRTFDVRMQDAIEVTDAARVDPVGYHPRV